ncbi:MAG: toprim domain-containing protein [Magnetococcales bacterium]|nr:toprim domain-containing protein [Magnetococcales bacterium]
MKPLAPGAIRGGAIRLYPVSGPVLGVAEGVETSLAVRAATGQPVWSAISASGMAALELPPEIHEVVVWADWDASGAGQQAAETLARRLVREGHAVRILVPPGPIQNGLKGIDWLDCWNIMDVAA